MSFIQEYFCTSPLLSGRCDRESRSTDTYTSEELAGAAGGATVAATAARAYNSCSNTKQSRPLQRRLPVNDDLNSSSGSRQQEALDDTASFCY